MPSAGFEPAIPEIKPLQTYALVRTDCGTGSYEITSHKYRLMRSAADIMGASNTWNIYSVSDIRSSADDTRKWTQHLLGMNDIFTPKFVYGYIPTGEGT